MDKIKARTLSGFMELLPGPQLQMERIMERNDAIHDMAAKGFQR